MIGQETTAIAPVRARANENHADAARMLLDQPVVLAGAGTLGRRVLAALRCVGIQPAAFADNNPKLWGSRIETIPVMSVEDAIELFSSTAVFVMTTWRPVTTGGLVELRRQLRNCRRVIPFPKVFWAFPEPFPPHFLWDRPSHIEDAWPEIERAYELMSDEISREHFAAHLALRATADFEAMPPLATHSQYFPPFLARSGEEHFVDCGAYDGDTIAAFTEWTGGRFRNITAFEADPGCYQMLQHFVASHPDPRIALRPEAVHHESGPVLFDATGDTSAGISEHGKIERPGITIDEAFPSPEDAPTFIKMDIEGAELNALAGAMETIRRDQPVLAVCVYHAQDHLWRVPLAIAQAFPQARFFLRSYCLDGFEAVCYAVPPGRVVKGAE